MNKNKLISSINQMDAFFVWINFLKKWNENNNNNDNDNKENMIEVYECKMIARLKSARRPFSRE